MPRSLWSGSLSFGLVNVPIQMVSGARDLDYHFHQLHEKDKARIEQRRFCKEEDAEVTWEEVAHSYDHDGKQVVVTDEELGSVQPRKTRTIEIEAFVELAEVDPIYFDHPYFLIPAGESEGTMRAYRLLVEVLADEERVALGTFVMRSKEYLAAVRARDGALALTTMRFHDEVRDPADVPGGKGKKPQEEGARPGDGDHRGPLDRMGPRELHRLLPQAPQEGDRPQAQGRQDRGAQAREGAEERPGPDGRAGGDAQAS